MLRNLSVLVLVLVGLCYSCQAPLEPGQHDSLGSDSPRARELVATVDGDLLSVKDTSGITVPNLDSSTETLLREIFRDDPTANEIYFEPLRPDTALRAAGDHIHNMTAKSKSGGSHELNFYEGKYLVKVVTCYKTNYVYSCTFCGASGGNYTTHSYPH